MVRNLLVVVRGPCGAGKSAVCRLWERRAPFDLDRISTDEVQNEVDLPDLSDDDEFDVVLDRVGAEIARRLARGPLLVDAGLRDPQHVERVLLPAGRGSGDPDVLMVRLTVGVEEAVRRKRDLPEVRVRELHDKWQTRPVPGEIVIPTEGVALNLVAQRLGEVLSHRGHHGPRTGVTGPGP